jgi:Acyl-CoA reductase (LuxC)
MYMKLQERKAILERLGTFMLSADTQWEHAKKKAFAANPWFIPPFIEQAVSQIASRFLAPAQLDKVIQDYHIPDQPSSPRRVGVVLAGNIPLVGFHDLLCIFLTGHYAQIKLSSKDEVLIQFLIGKLEEWNPETTPYFTTSDMLKGCDAYIATGSNNTSRYFEYYFSKYPHLIRKNRTSVAILTGMETAAELERLADDVYMYFGMGCRSVTKIYVPEGYDFIPLLHAFKKYNYLMDYNRYKNNYDYDLAILILNKRYYMTNESILLVEDPSPFSPIGQLHYEFYKNAADVQQHLSCNASIQCVVGTGQLPFGSAQAPGMCDFADGVDTIQFLLNLSLPMA